VQKTIFGSFGFKQWLSVTTECYPSYFQISFDALFWKAGKGVVGVVGGWCRTRSALKGRSMGGSEVVFPFSILYTHPAGRRGTHI